MAVGSFSESREKKKSPESLKEQGTKAAKETCLQKGKEILQLKLSGEHCEV